MISRPGQAFEAWRDADTAAREAEHRLQEAWGDYALGTGSPPAKDLIQEVARLRRVAHEKLTAAIAVIGSESHDHRTSRASRGESQAASRAERPAS
jgi:ferric-dicitrate binding protein FerR (iron transport regulator)